MGVWADRSPVRGADGGGGSVIEPKMLGERGREAGGAAEVIAIHVLPALAQLIFTACGGLCSLPRNQAPDCEGMVVWAR